MPRKPLDPNSRKRDVPLRLRPEILAEIDEYVNNDKNVVHRKNGQPIKPQVGMIIEAALIRFFRLHLWNPLFELPSDGVAHPGPKRKPSLTWYFMDSPSGPLQSKCNLLQVVDDPLQLEDDPLRWMKYHTDEDDA